MRDNSSPWTPHPSSLMGVSNKSLKEMAAFYTRFPYPGRPLWVRPRLEGMLQAHAGLGRLLVAQPRSVLLDNLAIGRPKIISGAWKNWLRELDRHFSSGSIALVGCGTDEPLLFAMLHNRCRIDAFDVSFKSLKIAKRKVTFYKHFLRTHDIHFIEGDATHHLSHSPRVYDFIQCFGVLHHQSNPELMVSAMANQLKTGGMLRLMVYTKSGRRIERWFQRKIRDTRGKLLWTPFFKVYLWMLWVRIMKINPWYSRFAYLRLWPKCIADALAHPSDPGLSFRNLSQMLIENHMGIIQIQYKHMDKGWKTLHRPQSQHLHQLAQEEESGHIISNIVFFAQKLG